MQNNVIKNVFLIVLVCWTSTIHAQPLSTRTFGNSSDKPLIFLHGGPGYNSVVFEETTAQELAAAGFFVISYDRRGEGRNEKLKATYTFEQSIADLNQIYHEYHLEKASLLGHSFGGVVATLFATKYPDKLQTLILVGAPVNMQATLKHIVAKSKAIYTEANDQINLNYITMLENMDSTSLEYSGYAFMHASKNGFYSPKELNNRAKQLYQTFRTNEQLIKYASKMEYIAPQKFWQNERYTSINIKDAISKLIEKQVKVVGMYGLEDGLFAKEQLADFAAMLGTSQVVLLENCSHNVFIDQQQQFITLLQGWIP